MNNGQVGDVASGESAVNNVETRPPDGGLDPPAVGSPNLPSAPLLGEGATDAPPKAVPFKAKLRFRNDTFYDDYLHRGEREPGPAGMLVDTPLRYMSYYTYAMFVLVTQGDPDDLMPNQYAFATHHAKYNDYVQQLRDAPVVPYIHGFTMPTKEKDPETNACFKQVLLRPHLCSGRAHCRKVGFTSGFCVEAGRCSRTAQWSYVQPWRRYLAEQLTLVEAADAAMRQAMKLSVLPDVNILRQWLHPEAVHHCVVQEQILPLLCGYRPHSSDSSLRGAWARRTPKQLQDSATEGASALSPCWCFSLPENLAWHVLRFAGHVADDDGSVYGIVNAGQVVLETGATVDDLTFLRTRVLGTEAEPWLGPCTSPGAHDEQLSPQMFFALKHVEVAARLEYMAEARGRPRLGQEHPDAEVVKE